MYSEFAKGRTKRWKAKFTVSETNTQLRKVMLHFFVLIYDLDKGLGTKHDQTLFGYRDQTC